MHTHTCPVVWCRQPPSQQACGIILLLRGSNPVPCSHLVWASLEVFAWDGDFGTVCARLFVCMAAAHAFTSHYPMHLLTLPIGMSTPCPYTVEGWLVVCRATCPGGGTGLTDDTSQAHRWHHCWLARCSACSLDAWMCCWSDLDGTYLSRLQGAWVGILLIAIRFVGDCLLFFVRFVPVSFID